MATDNPFVPGVLILDEPTQRGGKITHVNPADSDDVRVEWASAIDRPKPGPADWVNVSRLRVWS